VQVKPNTPLRPSVLPKELQQLLVTAQRTRASKPKTLLQLHIETIQAAAAIYARTRELRAATARLCNTLYRL
jgi:hypothetical protein